MIAESVALRAVRSEAPLGDGEKAWQRAVFDLAFFSSLGVWSSCAFFFSFFLNCLSPLLRQLKKSEREFSSLMSRTSALNLVQWLRGLGGFVDERLAVAVAASGSR